MADDPRHLPADLPSPVNDGACDHLVGLSMPDLRLASIDGGSLNLADLGRGWIVIYVYPGTGIPGIEMPEGWDAIPGARGCTPQSCSYRDDYSQLQELGVDVCGLSAQTTDAQREFAAREHIPFPLLSDPHREVGRALDLPVFSVGGGILYRRVTLIIHEHQIAHVRYPVFPPNEDATQTLRELRSLRC